MPSGLHDPIPAWVDGALAPMDKLDVHLKGVRHKAVSVFVLDGPRVLIQRRALGKYHTPGLWANTCCTHPHWNEAPRDCALRRLSQELGIDGLDPQPVDRVEYRADVGGGMVEHEVVDIFIAQAAGGYASNGEGPILDLQPTALHDRATLIIGPKADVELAERMVKEYA